ncbi:MAG: SPOR domain-containing protein [Candidatus Marinimicrobia bacterium]|nr:SPOR domain-containing protein [Candidatus Neomarinimicrobiota bacterium]
MKRLFLIALFVLFFLPGLIFTQDLNRYFEYIKQHNTEQVRAAIPELMQKYPNNPDILYLSALIEPDGDKALLIYKDVMSQYPNSCRADDALTKIIEYLYTKGLYNKTISYSKQLISKYPDSENIGNCVYMMLSSFNVMNKKDSVDYYYSYYLKRYPDMKLPFFNYQSASAYVTGDKPSEIVKKAPPEPKPVERTDSEPKWALQLGAFGNAQNALTLKNRLLSYGYEPYVQKIIGSTTDLLSVRIGNYNSQEEANAAGDRLKALHQIDFIVIKRNSWE